MSDGFAGDDPACMKGFIAARRRSVVCRASDDAELSVPVETNRPRRPDARPFVS